jgi:integrase
VAGYMTEQEAVAILNYAKHLSSRADDAARYSRIWHPLVATLMYTGVRSGEALALQWPEIEFDNDNVHIRFGMDRHRNRGHTKSKHGVRTVLLLPQLADILKEYRFVCTRQGADEKKFKASIANVSAVVRLLQLNPWMPNTHIARLLHISLNAVRNIRSAKGLPPAANAINGRTYRNRKVIMPSEPLLPPDAADEPGRLVYVFPTFTGRPMSYQTTWKRIREMQRDLDIIRRDAKGNPVLAKDGKPHAKYGQHAFRHFYMSFGAKSGIRIEDLQRYAGHSDEAMTKYYIHLFLPDPRCMAYCSRCSFDRFYAPQSTRSRAKTALSQHHLCKRNLLSPRGLILRFKLCQIAMVRILKAFSWLVKHISTC